MVEVDTLNKVTLICGSIAIALAAIAIGSKIMVWYKAYSEAVTKTEAKSYTVAAALQEKEQPKSDFKSILEIIEEGSRARAVE